MRNPRPVIRDLYRSGAIAFERMRGGRFVSPDFILGTQKSGTTFLYSSLILHPQVLEARFKEIHYLDWYRRKGMGWYRANFLDRSSREAAAVTTFDATPSYFTHPDAPGWIGKEFPEARMLVLLRDPIERSLSHYKHSVARGYETASLATALELEGGRLGEAGSAERSNPLTPASGAATFDRFGYVAKSRYRQHLERWSDVASRQKIILVRSESLFGEPKTVLMDVCKRLGLSPYETVKLGRTYSGRTASEASADAVNCLQEALKDERAVYDHIFSTSPVMELHDVTY